VSGRAPAQASEDTDVSGFRLRGDRRNGEPDAPRPPEPRVVDHKPKPPPPRLQAQSMSKRFGSLIALEDVSFELRPGSVHALLGENGAGKSTLVKCIMGFYRADSGRVVVGDSQVAISNPRDAQQLGVGMVYQHFTLVENMTVAENLVLARANRPAVINWKTEHAAIEAFMATTPFRVPLTKRVRQLAAGEKQKLEILKQLYLGSRIVILDEPTSVLTPQEADNVLMTLRGMVEKMELSVAIITHKFREVTAFADDVTVLRRGRVAGGGSARELSTKDMATLMVGGEVPAASMARSVRTANATPALVIENLHADDDIGLPVLEGFNLEVFPGEIVGVAGVSGNGQDELVEVLAGQRAASRGQLIVSGKPYRPTREQIRQQKVRLLPEAPLKNACVSHMTVSENMAFRTFDERPFARAGWFLDKAKMRARAEQAIADYRVKTPSPETPIGQLSGGNVQRAVLARELGEAATVLIAANPCFGLDIQAVSEIYQRIVAARESGTAVLIVSADLDEIFTLADRIVVISEGRVVHECIAADADRAAIGFHMGGASPHEASEAGAPAAAVSAGV
jgi:simple sugar transport system ATP-binding protein